MGFIFPKRGIFVNFQSFISPLSLMIELRLSLLTYRNSYFVHPKNLFSMTLNLCIKVKWLLWLDMKLNINKSCAIRIGERWQAPIPPLMVGKDFITWEKSLRYLGVVIV